MTKCQFVRHLQFILPTLGVRKEMRRKRLFTFFSAAFLTTKEAAQGKLKSMNDGPHWLLTAAKGPGGGMGRGEVTPNPPAKLPCRART
jgi:hypothetical protein